MDVFSVGTISLILLYVPGYIYIHVIDYFLLKREKPQFEITIQGLIASACIFIAFICWPYQLLNNKKELLITACIEALSNNTENSFKQFVITNIKDIGIFYFLLCLYSSIISLLFSLIRRNEKISTIIQKITQRDYFQSVLLRFYYESLNQIVIITMDNNNKYMGFLIGAPDNEQSNHIILCQPLFFENSEFKYLQAEKILIDANKISLIEVLTKENKNGNKRRKSKFQLRGRFTK